MNYDLRIKKNSTNNRNGRRTKVYYGEGHMDLTYPLTVYTFMSSIK